MHDMFWGIESHYVCKRCTPGCLEWWTKVLRISFPEQSPWFRYFFWSENRAELLLCVLNSHNIFQLKLGADGATHSWQQAQSLSYRLKYWEKILLAMYSQGNAVVQKKYTFVKIELVSWSSVPGMFLSLFWSAIICILWMTIKKVY